MNKKRLIISSVISIFLVSILLLGSTYSIFTSEEIDETANVYKTGNLNVTYKVSSNTIHFTDPTPMTIEEADSVIPYRITITNTGNVPYEFDVILLDTTSSTENTIDYQYIITKVGYLEPVALSDCTNNIIKENVIVPAGESVDIDVRIWLDSNLSNTEIGKSFYAKLKIDGLAVYNDDENIDNSKLSLRYIKAINSNIYYKSDTYRNYITTASVVDYIDTSNVAFNSDTNEKIMWDISTPQDKSVIAWLEENGEVDESGHKLYDLYIGSWNKIYSVEFHGLSVFFDSMSMLNSVSISNLAGQSVAHNMFRNCSNLTSVDLSGFDTRNVTNMSGMFQKCSNLTSLDLSSFDTGNVTNMAFMFMNCTNLTSLDLSHFDTGNVTSFSSMFSSCSSLTSLDLSRFGTGNVTEMDSMFAGCNNLISLDLSNFNTGNVIRIYAMFYNCKNLTSLNLSSFDTGNATRMDSMFYNCSSLTSLDLSSFNTSNVTTMKTMFQLCLNLTSLDLSSFDTSNVTDMSIMFGSCNNLTSLDLSSFDTSNVTNMSDMFQNCSNLTSLDLSSFDTSNVTRMDNMFYNCSSLTGLYIEGWNVRSVTNYSGMFNKAATVEGASITVYYVGDNPNTTDVNESTESLVEDMIATKSSGSNVINGGCVGNYCSV